MPTTMGSSSTRVAHRAPHASNIARRASSVACAGPYAICSRGGVSVRGQRRGRAEPHKHRTHTKQQPQQQPRYASHYFETHIETQCSAPHLATPHGTFHSCRGARPSPAASARKTRRTRRCWEPPWGSHAQPPPPPPSAPCTTQQADTQGTRSSSFSAHAHLMAKNSGEEAAQRVLCALPTRTRG